MLPMTRHFAQAVSLHSFCKGTQTHSSFPFLFSHCTYSRIMDFGTLFYVCHTFPNYFTVRLVLQTFKYLLVFKTGCWMKI